MAADVPEHVATVAIPVYNGERYLDEVLTAVGRQEVEGAVEVLVWDSGSGDRSLAIARDHGATTHSIPKSTFSHGGTRNAMAAAAKAPYVAFLTQDATPASPRWLACLLEGFRAADDVAAVFGPHVARPDASHMIKAEMQRHFATWGEGGRQLDVQKLRRTPDELAAYRARPGAWTFLSDVNCCIDREVLRRIPYRAVPYAEDQLLGRELIEAGYSKVFHPGAAVVHSHDYSPVTFFRRYFDEFRSLREVLDHVEPAGPIRTARSIKALSGADRRWLRAQGVSGVPLARAVGVSVRHHSVRMAGAVLGTRADSVPAAGRKLLSLEGRASFEPVTVAADVASANPSVKEVVPDGKWPWEWVRTRYPLRPLELEAHEPRAAGPMSIAWVVPPWGIGSGGHTTIFRLIAQLERRGHRCVVHLFDPFGMDGRQGWVLRDEIRRHFVPIEAQVFRGFDDWRRADVAVATNWWSAWAVRDLTGCLEKAYLVQDDEARFYSTSAEQLWAEETYRMGYRGIAFTRWMAERLERQHGMSARHFDCGTDLDSYPFGDGEREPGLIAVYARRETDRRAVDLALAGLATLVERRPGIRIAFFGSNVKPLSPVVAHNFGVLPPRHLSELYRQASAGVVLSLTTHSLVSQEMMASGLPVVELNGDNVTSSLGADGDRALLTEPHPDAIADALGRILDDPADARAMALRARRFVEQLTWEGAGDQVEDALADFLATPTHQRRIASTQS